MKKIALDKIRLDGGTQLRDLDLDHVAELKRALEISPAALPSIILFFDGKHYWPGDGFHRYHANAELKHKTIPAEVRKGTQRDALRFACGANARHGKPRSIADKRTAVVTMLTDAEWGEKSDRWIAEQCVVSHGFVADIRKSTGNATSSRQGKDGKKRGWKDVSDKPEVEAESEDTEQIPLEKSRKEPADDIEETSIDTKSPESAPAVKADATGMAITDLAILSIFNRAVELEDLARKVSDIKSLVTHACDAGDELFTEINLAQFQADAKNLYRAIRFAIPHAVCRFCGGKRKGSCKNCNGRGWTGEAKFKATPEEMK